MQNSIPLIEPYCAEYRIYVTVFMGFLIFPSSLGVLPLLAA